MKKIIIIGCPGSGKSTFARELHRITHLPLVHLDLLFWNADGTSVPREIFLLRLEDALQKDHWIIDGNYHTTMEQRLSACDTVIFLDYPQDVCLAGAKERRGKPRPDLPWIEPEGTQDEDEFFTYIRNYEQERRPGVFDLLARYPQKNSIIFTTRDQADAYLRKLTNHKEDSHEFQS